MNILLLSTYGTENFFNRRMLEECLFFAGKLRLENPYHHSLPLQEPMFSHQFTVLRSTGINYDDFDLTLMKYLEGLPIPSLNPWNEHQIFRDKANQWQWYQSHRIPHIPTALPKGPDILNYIVENFKTTKYVIKTRRGNQSRGTWLINQNSSLKTWLNYLSNSNDKNFIVQPYLNFRQEWRVLFIGKKSWSFLKNSSDNHEFLSGNDLPFVHKQAPAEVSELAVKIQKNLYANFFSVDVGLTSQGPVVIEVNLISGLEKAEAACKQNLMRELLITIQTLRKERNS